MKVKVIKAFRDKNTGELYKVGKILNIKKERFEEIIAKGKLVEEIKEDKATKPAK